MAKNFVSNSTESTRIFKSNFLESFSRVHWTVPMITYIPVVLFFIYRSFFVVNTSALQFICMFAVGLVSWSLFEYIMHRWIFHFVPKSKWGLRLLGWRPFWVYAFNNCFAGSNIRYFEFNIFYIR